MSEGTLYPPHIPLAALGAALQRESSLLTTYLPGGLISTFLVFSGLHSMFRVYRGTSSIRNRLPLGPYRRPMPRALGGS